MALQTKKGVPFEFLTLQLCREFHCLPSQIKKESWKDVELILDMLAIEQQFAERDNRLATSKYGRKQQ